MTDRPIIFSAPMVLALLDGRKTQTRRVLKHIPQALSWDDLPSETQESLELDGWKDFGGVLAKASFDIADRLWVRENHAIVPWTAYRASEGVQQIRSPVDTDDAAIYAAGWERSKPRWRPSIHMPRWASRLTLPVTEVRVERLQDISEADAIAEGMPDFGTFCETLDPGRLNAAGETAAQTASRLRWPQRWFASLWNEINGPDAWDANPWVAAISFTVHRANIDAIQIGAAA